MMAAPFEDPETEIWLSPISLWELSLLSKRKKVVLNLPVDEWVAEALARAPMREAHVTYEIAMETGSIELPHRDPADRFLAATAKVFDLTLVTADERLLGLQDVSLMSNL